MFYFIIESRKNNEINDTQKRFLKGFFPFFKALSIKKDMVIIENLELLTAFKLYEENKNIQELKKSIFTLLRFTKSETIDMANGFFSEKIEKTHYFLNLYIKNDVYYKKRKKQGKNKASSNKSSDMSANFLLFSNPQLSNEFSYKILLSSEIHFKSIH